MLGDLSKVCREGQQTRRLTPYLLIFQTLPRLKTYFPSNLASLFPENLFGCKYLKTARNIADFPFEDILMFAFLPLHGFLHFLSLLFTFNQQDGIN